MSTTITLKGALPTVSFLPASLALKEEVIKQSLTITKIEDRGDYEIAQVRRNSVKALLKRLEDSRKEEKAPVLELGRAIDERAKEFAKELEAEDLRVKKLMEPFAAAEEKKRQDALREAQRKQEEAAAAQRAEEQRAFEAEQAILRQEAEKARTAEKARLTSRDRLAALEAEKAAETARIASEEARQANEEVQRKASEALALTQPKVKGVNVQKFYRIMDFGKAFAARPDLFTVTEKRQELLYNIRRGVQIPGIEVYEETVVK